MKYLVTFLLLYPCFFSFGKGNKHRHGKDKEQQAYHSFYDDSTMLARTGPILLPYNRYIDPAGAMVTFGIRDNESHALDGVLLPDGHTLAVEERFGIAFINTNTNELISYWEYGAQKAFKNFVSTYSGIKTLSGQTQR
jgi:hypothetical protein